MLSDLLSISRIFFSAVLLSAKQRLLFILTSCLLISSSEALQNAIFVFRLEISFLSFSVSFSVFGITVSSSDFLLIFFSSAVIFVFNLLIISSLLFIRLSIFSFAELISVSPTSFSS